VDRPPASQTQPALKLIAYDVLARDLEHGQSVAQLGLHGDGEAPRVRERGRLERHNSAHVAEEGAPNGRETRRQAHLDVVATPRGEDRTSADIAPHKVTDEVARGNRAVPLIRSYSRKGSSIDKREVRKQVDTREQAVAHILDHQDGSDLNRPMEDLVPHARDRRGTRRACRATVAVSTTVLLVIVVFIVHTDGGGVHVDEGGC